MRHLGGHSAFLMNLLWFSVQSKPRLLSSPHPNHTAAEHITHPFLAYSALRSSQVHRQDLHRAKAGDWGLVLGHQNLAPDPINTSFKSLCDFQFCSIYMLTAQAIPSASWKQLSLAPS